MSHQPVQWAEIECPEQQGFTAEHTDDGIVVKGTCPRCQVETRWPFPNVLRGIEPIKSVTVICACGYPHEDRPDAKNESGCGAFWKIPTPS
jgi:hypothetical protein